MSDHDRIADIKERYQFFKDTIDRYPGMALVLGDIRYLLSRLEKIKALEACEPTPVSKTTETDKI